MKIYDYNGKKNICGDRLREARVVRRLRQEDLPAQIQLKGINMERDSISRIEIGTRFVFGKKFSQIFKSITFDNGSEFMDCAGIEKSIYGKDRKRTKVYYCHPYSAYERGTNENINKMIRRFLPKGTDFRKVTAAYIQRVETWINNYPREILGFETSGSLFERYVAEAA